MTGESSSDHDTAIPYSAPYPRHLPSATEIEHTRLQIQQDQRKIKSLEDDLEAARQLMTKLDENIKSLNQGIDNKRAFIAPIRSLPFEVLGEVMKCCAVNQSPWLLTSICRTWRQCALGTPRLWSQVVVTNPLSQNVVNRSVQNRWRNGEGEVCNTVARLERALARAGVTPLDITIDITMTYGSWGTKTNLTTKPILEMLRLLSGERMRQWRAFTIKRAQWDQALRFEGALVNLESISILQNPSQDHDGLRNLLDIVDETATHLKDLTLPISYRGNLSDKNWWDSLTTLSLGVSTDIEIILKRCVNVQTLTLQFTFFAGDLVERITLPKLRALQLGDCHPRFLPIILTNVAGTLAELKMSGSLVHVTPFVDDPVELPQLRRLLLKNADLSSYSRVSVPNIEELHVHYDHTPYKKVSLQAKGHLTMLMSYACRT